VGQGFAGCWCGDADILIQNLRPGIVDEFWGSDRNAMMAVNPRLKSTVQIWAFRLYWAVATGAGV